MSTASVLDNEKALEMDNGPGDFSGEMYETFRDNTKPTLFSIYFLELAVHQHYQNQTKRERSN